MIGLTSSAGVFEFEVCISDLCSNVRMQKIVEVTVDVEEMEEDEFFGKEEEDELGGGKDEELGASKEER